MKAEAQIRTVVPVYIVKVRHRSVVVRMPDGTKRTLRTGDTFEVTATADLRQGCS